MYRKIAATAAILTAGLMIGAPAFAALTGAGANDRPSVESDTTTTAKPSEPGVTARPQESKPTTTIERPEPKAPAARTAARPKLAAEERRKDVEQLRLACAGGRVDDVGAVRCHWSASASPHFTHYVLYRQGPDRTPRSVVFRTTNRNVTSFADKPLRAGLYRYRLFAMSGRHEDAATAGRPVGTSPVVEVTVPRPTPDAEPVAMRLECKPAAAPARPSVVCRWSMSTAERFAGYRVSRETRGTPSEVWFRTADRNVTSATDGDVRPGVTYAYRVVTMDGDGRVIGSGGPVTVTIPAGTGDALIK